MIARVSATTVSEREQTRKNMGYRLGKPPPPPPKEGRDISWRDVCLHLLPSRGEVGRGLPSKVYVRVTCGFEE